MQPVATKDPVITAHPWQSGPPRYYRLQQAPRRHCPRLPLGSGFGLAALPKTDKLAARHCIFCARGLFEIHTDMRKGQPA